MRAIKLNRRLSRLNSKLLEDRPKQKDDHTVLLIETQTPANEVMGLLEAPEIRDNPSASALWSVVSATNAQISLVPVAQKRRRMNCNTYQSLLNVIVPQEMAGQARSMLSQAPGIKIVDGVSPHPV